MKLGHIKYYIFILFPALMMSSCASILNSSMQKVSVTSDKQIKIISLEKSVYKESGFVDSNHAKSFFVFRSSMPLSVNLEVDSIHKTILLYPRSSFAYWLNIFFNYGIGMLIDKDNPKRYSYSRDNHITIKDSILIVHKFSLEKKNNIKLTISPTLVNSFSINTGKHWYQSAGIFGLEAGVEYYYNKNKFISVNAGAATDVFGDYFGKGYSRTTSTVFTNFRDNRTYCNFNVGYGLNVSYIRWIEDYRGDSIYTHQLSNVTTLGLSVSVQYRLGNYIYAGVLYQPSFVNTNNLSSFNYQHFLSFNLIGKIPL